MVMARHTTFRLCLDPTVEQCEVLARHAGASRFAFNQCLRLVKTSLTHRKTDPDIEVPWTGFDLINTFNAWKKTEAAGRVFAVGARGETEVRVTGLAWRGQVCQQVFEEAAVDLGRGLAAWSDSRSGKRKGRRASPSLKITSQLQGATAQCRACTAPTLRSAARRRGGAAAARTRRQQPSEVFPFFNFWTEARPPQRGLNAAVNRYRSAMSRGGPSFLNSCGI